MIKLLCTLSVAIMFGLVKLRGLVIYLDLSSDSTRKHVVGFYFQGKQTTIDHNCLTWDIQTKITVYTIIALVMDYSPVCKRNDRAKFGTSMKISDLLEFEA